MHDEHEFVTIAPGIALQGDGGVSTDAVVLQNKQSSPGTDIILCLAPRSPHDPYVVWTYVHETGQCQSGKYFPELAQALAAYDERTW